MRTVAAAAETDYCRANAANQSLADRKEERGRLIGRFTNEPLKRAGGNLQQQAVLVCDHIRGARAVIEQRHFAEEFAGRQRCQNALLAGDHQPNAHFPFEHQIHGVPGAALFDDFTPLPHRVNFGEAGEPFELRVGQSGKDSNTPEGARSRSH